MRDDEAAAIKSVMEFCDIFGKDRFFLELMDHRIPDQTKVNKGLMRIGKKTGLPFVATNDAHYLHRTITRRTLCFCASAPGRSWRIRTVSLSKPTSST